ncbi:hypothetical protein K5713_04295 [Trueperella pyogenes]|uniref:hypothetical protein n=1 Tax=Trueperella pyogenes TaxID=1661 RepID=UPI002169BB6C|nr:hypothetical protein [Trueperella pyogenes]UVJ54509.1 hypothetical protein K5713_04295 [Trueperella pyogenes]
MENFDEMINLSDVDLTGFINTITTAEAVALAETEDDGATLLTIALIAAHRLGFSELTRDDIGALPMSKLGDLITAGAEAPANTPEVLSPLLARISK